MPKVSAGIFLFRRRGRRGEVFLVHPGGPFWARRDLGAWSVPKGIVNDGEDPLAAAKREFTEETGFSVDGDFIELGSFRQPGGKLVRVWAVEGDCDADEIASNEFEMEWPPQSGRTRRFPEVDRGGWFTRTQAAQKLLKGQREALDALFAGPLKAKRRPVAKRSPRSAARARTLS